jgi:heavy metal translocating P-type ATPase
VSSDGAPTELTEEVGPTVWRSVPFVGAVSGFSIGVVAWLLGAGTIAAAAWAAATAVALITATIGTVRDLLAREAGVDIVALIAMIGALLLQEWFAGAVIALMLTGGEALERYATARASRDLSDLLSRRPAVAHRERGDGAVEEVDVDDVDPGDVVVVRIGEVVPVDGIVLEERAILDESALTGEARPAELTTGEPVRSGGLNIGGPVRIRAAATASDSTYEGILRLVREAETSKPRLVRLADRYAAWFAPFALLVAGAAWLWSGDPVRALAVVVVATPCPLLLAAPAAIVSGVSRAAREGIIVKGGAGLEALAHARVALLDKTGTITAGRPEVSRVITLASLAEDEVLRLAAALDQVSVHPFAPSIVRAGTERGLTLPFPQDGREQLGEGVAGSVDGVDARVGRLEWVASGPPPRTAERIADESATSGTSAVFVARSGEIVGALILEDPIEPTSRDAIQRLREEGLSPIVMVTGDHRRIADRVGSLVGVDRVLADRSPDGKVVAVREARTIGPTLMAGDGVNDAPALALSDVGVAMGARGGTAASEAADVVVAVGGLDGVAQAVAIAKRSQRIARQSALGGMVLAGIAMFIAAAGYLPPAAGAVVQEVIDLGVILNALRALRSGRTRATAERTPRTPATRSRDRAHAARDR